MECVILFRNAQNGVVGFVGQEGDPDKMEVFDDMEDAIRASERVPILRVFPYQIVELDEL